MQAHDLRGGGSKKAREIVAHNKAAKTAKKQAVTDDPKVRGAERTTVIDGVDKGQRTALDPRRRHCFDPSEIKRPELANVYVPAVTAGRIAQIERLTDPKAALAAIADLYANYPGAVVARANHYSSKTGVSDGFTFEPSQDWGKRIALNGVGYGGSVVVHPKVAAWLDSHLVTPHKAHVLKATQKGENDVVFVPDYVDPRYAKTVRIFSIPPLSRAEIQLGSQGAKKDMSAPRWSADNGVVGDSPQRTAVLKVLASTSSVDKALTLIADALLTPGAQWIGKGGKWQPYATEPVVRLHHGLIRTVDLKPAVYEALRRTIVDGGTPRFLMFRDERYIVAPAGRDTGGSVEDAAIELFKLEQ